MGLGRLVLAFVRPFYSEKVAATIRWVGDTLRIERIEKRFAKCGRDLRIGDGFSIIGAEHIRIGDNFRAGRGLTLEAWAEYGNKSFMPELVIGNDVSFTDYDHISCVNHVEIGNGCLLGHNVYISDNSHGTETKN